MKKIIDVSEHQGIIKWDQVKKNIDGAIIRVGYGDNIPSQDDKYFKRNVAECIKYNIPFEVYIYSYATNIDKAQSEADHVLRLITPYKQIKRVWLDMEDKSTIKSDLGVIAKIFFRVITSKGYKVGTYANTYWFNNVLKDDIFNVYPKWVAEYETSKCNYKGTYIMWQYTSKAKVPGIDGNVDMNYLHEDNNTKPKDKINVIYQVYAAGKWLPNVCNLQDYAGIFGKAISGIYANLSKGNIKYRVYSKGKWLPWVLNRNDFAGILNNNIQGIQMQLLNLSGYNVKYRAYVGGKWLPWVVGLEDYAGILGQTIEGIQIEVI